MVIRPLILAWPALYPLRNEPGVLLDNQRTIKNAYPLGCGRRRLGEGCGIDPRGGAISSHGIVTMP